MLKNIVSDENLDTVLDSIKSTNIIFIPLFNTNPIISGLTKINVAMIYSLDTDKKYIFVFNHSEYESLNFTSYEKLINTVCSMNTKVFCICKKDILKVIPAYNFIDINIFEYIYDLDIKSSSDFFTNAHNFVNRLDPHPFFDTVYYIPLIKIFEQFNNILTYYKSIIESHYFVYDDVYKFLDITINVFYKLESSGIAVDRSKIKDPEILFKGKIYPDYNLYTRTFRPISSKGIINIGNLSRKNKDREFIISRFENGRLVEFDYVAHTLYLASRVLKEKFDSNPYLEIGRMLFNKKILSEEEYKNTKAIVYKCIFGTLDIDHPFIKKLNTLKKELSNYVKSSGYIESDLIGLKISCTPENALSAFLQSTETENNILVLSKVQNYIEQNELKSRLIFYNYDSFLFDVCDTETEHILEFQKIINCGAFNTHIRIGKNYNDMVEI